MEERSESCSGCVASQNAFVRLLVTAGLCVVSPPGTFQHRRSSLNKQKDADRFLPVLGHLKDAKHTQLLISSECLEKWTGIK